MKQLKRWPHMFLTLSPTYVGLAQAAIDFTIKYLRGEMPNTPPVKKKNVCYKAINSSRNANSNGKY